MRSIGCLIGKHGPGNAALPLPEHRNLPEFTLLDDLFGRDSLYMGINLYKSFPSCSELRFLDWPSCRELATGPTRKSLVV